MRTPFFRRPTILLVLTGAVMLVMGLAGGYILGSGRGTAHATPMQGFIDIYNGTDLFTCDTFAYGCSPTPVLSNACHTEGSSDWIACDFQVETHSGGAIHQENFLPCYNFTSQGYQVATQSTIDYTPSGNVHIRCEFPYPPNTMGLRVGQPAA